MAFAGSPVTLPLDRNCDAVSLRPAVFMAAVSTRGSLANNASFATNTAVDVAV